MAHKKGQGSVRNGRDSNAKYLGVKKYAALTSTKATMSVWAGTLPCSPLLTAR